MGLDGLTLPKKLNFTLPVAGDGSVPAPSSASQGVLEQLTAQLAQLPEADSRSLRPLFAELRLESDPSFLYQELLHAGVRMKSEQRLEAAQLLLGRLAQADLPAEIRDRALREFRALTGSGVFGARAEFLLSRFCKDATDPRLIAPMLAGTVVGELAGTFALGRLAGTAAEGSAWLGRGVSSRFAAGLVGYSSEVAAFAAFSRAMAPQSNGSIGDDLARSALTIGALRVFGGLGRSLNESFAVPASNVALRGAVSHGSTFAGLIAAHKLEERLGLRPHVEGSTFLLDTFASLVSLGVGAHLGRRALGSGFANFQAELQARTAAFDAPAVQDPVSPLGLQPAWAMAGAGPRGLTPSAHPAIEPLLMSMMGPGGKRDSGAAPEVPALAASAGEGDKRSQHRLSQKQNDPLPPPPASEAPDPMIGQIIDGRYRIERKLGEGGMGFVYLATHKIIGKKVAIKVLRPEIARDKDVLARFVNEARAATSIGNPHIIEINDFGELPNGSTYYAMEFLNGKSLENLLSGETPVPVERIVPIALQLTEALGAAHRAGIVHRDLKTENIYLVQHGNTPDFVKILDFGIAKMSSVEGTKLTRDGEVFGTPAYMSPEQAGGVPVDRRGDIYSVGVILFEMASGKLPYMAESYAGLLTKHMFHPPVPVRSLPSTPKDFPEWFEKIILRCMAKHPDNRYQSMEELQADLRSLSVGIEPKAVEIVRQDPDKLAEPIHSFPLPPAKSRWPFAVGIGGLAGLSGFLLYLLMTHKAEQPQPAGLPADAPPAPDASPAKTDAPPQKVSPLKYEVTVTVEPPDAHVFVGDKDLGSNMATVPVEEGSTVEIEVRRKGYVTKKLTLDGTNSDERVRLEPEGKRPPQIKHSGGTKPPPAGSGSAKPKRPGDEVVVPWKN